MGTAELEEGQQLLKGDRSGRESLVDLRLSLLDSLRDRDLAVPVEERDDSELPQVRSRGVGVPFDLLAESRRARGASLRRRAGRILCRRPPFHQYPFLLPKPAGGHSLSRNEPSTGRKSQ